MPNTPDRAEVAKTARATKAVVSKGNMGNLLAKRCTSLPLGAMAGSAWGHAGRLSLALMAQRTPFRIKSEGGTVVGEIALVSPRGHTIIATLHFLRNFHLEWYAQCAFYGWASLFDLPDCRSTDLPPPLSGPT
jgi:hypothetical protein